MPYILFSLLALLLVACGRDKPTPASPSTLEQVDSLLATASAWAPVCDFKGIKAPSKASVPSAGVLQDAASCDNGDGLLWNGILCSQLRPEGLSDASGINPKWKEAACAYVKASQDKDGRLWRGPHLVGKDKPNSFSRDMAVGFLLYVQATKDYSALERWAAFVVQHEGRMCGVGATPNDYATDNRCDSMSGIRGLAKLVHRGLDWKGLPAHNLEAILLGHVATARAGELGYPQHLVAQQLILLQRLGFESHALWGEAAAWLHKRNPRNPLFAHLAGRNDLAVELLLQQVPTSRPDRQNQWSFEREDKEEAWRRTMVWEQLWLRERIQ